MSASERKLWGKSAHERRVENFYGVGAEHFGSYHDGYLNFGLWDEGVEGYVAAAENLVRRVGTLAELDGRSRVLDVACGMGTQDLYLLRNFSPASIDALDVTWKHVEQGRRRAADAGLSERVNFHHGTATALPFPDQTFTHVLGIEGPVHFDTRETFMREARRVLAPGGRLVLSDYSMKRPPRTAFEKFVFDLMCRLWKVPGENRDTVARYRDKLERSGFTDAHIEEVGERVIPGYYFEQKRPETVRELTRLRGFVAGRLGGVIDTVLYKVYRLGLIDYILVRARKAG